MTKKEQVKENIGRAAMQCFARYGLEKTTLEDIAKAVGLNKASLYYYYKNKEDIFIEVAIKEGEQYLAALRQDTLGKTTISGRILYYLEERINYYRHVLNMNKVSADTLARMLPRFFELYEGLMAEETRFLEGMLAEAMSKNELVSTDAGKLAASLISMSDALKHSTEQKANLKNMPEADYTGSIEELKFLTGLIFKGLSVK